MPVSSGNSFYQHRFPERRWLGLWPAVDVLRSRAAWPEVMAHVPVMHVAPQLNLMGV